MLYAWKIYVQIESFMFDEEVGRKDACKGNDVVKTHFSHI